MSEPTAGFIPATRFEHAPNLEMRFPPLPRTVAEVSNLIAEQLDVPDTHRLVEIVNTDPLVSASVLRRINSAYYGMRRRIGDIRKAIFLLGFLEVCNIVLTAGMMKLKEVVHSAEQEKIFEQIMRLSLGAAFFGQEIAMRLQLPGKASAFTVGLLHAVGRLVLLYNKPNDYEALWWTNEDGFAPTPAAEQLIFGTDHAQLGALALERWHLPDDIVTVVRSYRTPGQIRDDQLQPLALALLVSISATEHLYKINAGRQSFEPTAQMAALAKSARIPVADLVEFIESISPQAVTYVEEMLHS